jgi:arabinogalactan oligomer/maltooligosaccharide transport system permease protein
VTDQQRRGADVESAPRPSLRSRLAPGRAGTSGLLAKLLLLGLVNGIAVAAAPRLITTDAWFGLAAVVLATLAIDAVYLTKRAVPLKYLVPGTVFLIAFQLYPVIFNSYIAFTNLGTGNILSQEQAIEQVLVRSVQIPPDAVRYQATPLVGPDGTLALLLESPDGELLLGTAEGAEPLAPEDVGELDGRVAVGEYTRMSLGEAADREDEVLGLRVPLADGELRLQTFTTAARAVQTLTYDAEREAMVSTVDDTVYESVDGYFVSAQGERLTPGWQITVGFDNFTRIVRSPAIRGPFFRVFVWTYVFAIASVVITFAVGLLLATTLNDPRVRGLRYYRAILVIPYALPSFMTALIWAGLLNQDFGVVNALLNADIPWLNDPWLAKLSVVLVNTWLGFPYMFLICLGALQAIPSDLKEAAFVDGASGPQAFRHVTLPLLLVATAPILIASFAFNFNNFNVVYLLTGGGPPIVGAQTPAGHTDILISYTYRLAFETGRGADFGFAAAISVVIFIMVAIVSAFSFKYTKTFEEIN